MKGAKKVASKKVETVKEFTELAKEYPIVGIVNMENLPAKQLQRMRQNLEGKVIIKMTKKRLMKHILENVKDVKPDIEKLLDHLKGMPAMIFTRENPFKLYSELDKSKSSAPAKPGQTATNDIYVEAGPTPFSPGPIIGELGSLKIKAGIENGKVAIKETVRVVKEGEEISANVAGILTRLGIEPMEIGLGLVAVYEDGSVFTKDVLAIDETQYLTDVKRAALDSISLAIGIGYPTAESLPLLIKKAHADARGLAVAQAIPAEGIMELLLGKAEGEMLGLKAKAKISDEPSTKPEKAEPEAPEAKEEQTGKDTEEPVNEEGKAEEEKSEKAEEAKQEAEEPAAETREIGGEGEEEDKQEAAPADKKEEKKADEDKKGDDEKN